MAFSQKKENTISFSVGPCISTSTTFFNATYDKDFFYTWQPYISFTAESVFKQKLSKHSYIATGLGFTPMSFKFFHDNYYTSFQDELMFKVVSCINFKVPLFFEHNYNLGKSGTKLVIAGGGEFNFIHGYGESSQVTGGFATDSTLYAVYEKNQFNVSVRFGIEVKDLFKNERLSTYTIVTYLIRPFGEIYVLNSSNDVSEDFIFRGSAAPSQLGISIGLTYLLFNVK